MVRVKICGITNPADARLASELGAHALGFNFYEKSPRAVSPADAWEMRSKLAPFVSAIGIFVDWKPCAVTALATSLRLDAVQLHGDECARHVDDCSKRLPVIKVLHVGSEFSEKEFSRFRLASAFLLDAFPDANKPKQFGGTGKTIDWSLAAKFAKSYRIILAGGLTPENVVKAIRTVRPYAVDVTSGVESRPGKKDLGKLRAFFDEVARANRFLALHPADDPFFGTWELDPASLDYQHGRPGRRATYIIEPTEAGMQFHLDGDDPDGKRMTFTYGGPLDGREQPIPATNAVLVLTRPSETVIESILKRNGKIADRWTRELLPDHNTIRIVQYGSTPDGREFRNTSLYRRK